MEGEADLMSSLAGDRPFKRTKLRSQSLSSCLIFLKADEEEEEEEEAIAIAIAIA